MQSLWVQIYTIVNILEVPQIIWNNFDETIPNIFVFEFEKKTRKNREFDIEYPLLRVMYSSKWR